MLTMRPHLPFALGRTALALASAATMWFHAAAGAETPRLLLTFDDGPSLQTTPVLAPAARNQALLDTLARHKAHAVLFITLGFGADRPEGHQDQRRAHSRRLSFLHRL